MKLRALVLAVTTLLGSGCSHDETPCTHVGACNEPSGVCADVSMVNMTMSANVLMHCQASGGEWLVSCPTADLAASCSGGECGGIAYYYGSFGVDSNGHDLAFLEASCRAAGRVWTTY